MVLVLCMLQCPAGDAKLVEDAEVAEGGLGRVLTTDQAGISGEERVGFFAVLS